MLNGGKDGTNVIMSQYANMQIWKLILPGFNFSLVTWYFMQRSKESKAANQIIINN